MTRKSLKSVESAMRQQKRPFVVEIKQKRGVVKRPQSIWSGIDLGAIANDVADAKTEGAIAEATPEPISADEHARSQLVLATGEAASDTKDVADASIPEPATVEEENGSALADTPTTVKRPRSSKRRRKEVPLPRSERWKRRLPWILRQRRRDR